MTCDYYDNIPLYPMCSFIDDMRYGHVIYTDYAGGYYIKNREDSFIKCDSFDSAYKALYKMYA